MPQPFLADRRVLLRPLVAADAHGTYPDWMNDAEVSAGTSHHIHPYTIEAAERYILETGNGSDAVVLAMVARDTLRHIGNIALQRIDPVHRSAEFAIMIGDTTSWGQGYGAAAGFLLLTYGFDVLNLYRVGCGTFEDNHRMRRLAERLGMREEGRRRCAAFKGGRFIDVIEFGVLADEFRASVRADG